MVTKTQRNIRDLRQWLCWRIEEREGKPTKVPYSPLTGKKASSTDPETWASYSEAVEAYTEHGYAGIGFVFSKDDPFCGVDLDGCMNPETGELEEWAREIIEELDSYTEVSPSGSGVHVLVRGELPPGRNRKGRIEMYDRGRYFTVTGRHLAGTPPSIESRQEELTSLARRVFGDLAVVNGPKTPTPEFVGALSDEEIIEKASAAENSENFLRLWGGDTGGYEHDDNEGHSEADLALCAMLAFWTGPDPDRIAKLFRHSGLYRKKWERKDYRERTIARALEGRTEFYEPRQTAPLKDNSVKCDSGETTMDKALEGVIEFYTATDDEWEDPVPLPEGLPPAAPLDPTMLPEPLRGWIVDVSERMQIPPDFAAVGAVVVAGSLIGRQVGIRPKRQDDWLVVPNLWGAVVGRPSLMKSPALAEIMKPLGRLVSEAYAEYREAKVVYETDVMVAEATKAALKDELKRAAREAARSGNRSNLEEIACRSQDTEVPKEPLLKRYKTEDATVEKISEILLENPRGILVHRDELSGWLRNLDKQGREGDRSFYLEAWNGTGSFDVDRIGRGSLHIPALCISILGSIQPGPLSIYVYQATQGEKGDDGLLQRFQLLVWPDPHPTWRNVDRWPDVEAKNRAYEVFRRLDALNPEDFGASGEDEESIPAVRFTGDAQEIFDQWRDELEIRLRSTELPPALESHLAKYRSLMPSLALIFQLIEFVDGTGEGGAVGIKSTLQAGAWCGYLETHAARLYSSAENPAIEGARALLERIRKGEVSDGDSTRSVYRKHWAKLSTPEEVNSACQVLEEFGWLRIEVAKTSGRSTTRLRLHPTLREQP
jgi:putative DNA primase/helicase